MCSQGASVHPQCPRQDSGDHSATLVVETISLGICSPQVLSLKEAGGETIPSVGSAARRAARLRGAGCGMMAGGLLAGKNQDICSVQGGLVSFQSQLCSLLRNS